MSLGPSLATSSASSMLPAPILKSKTQGNYYNYDSH